jgi:putative DNA primase/helicase
LVDDKFQHRLSDTANAQRFYNENKDNLAYVPQGDYWLVWCGSHWQKDNGAEVGKRAEKISEVILNEAQMESVTERKQMLIRHSANLLNHAKIIAMIKRAMPHFAKNECEFDTDIELLNCLNGTVNLRTGILQSHNPKDYITRVIHYEFDFDANASRWNQFIAEIFPGDADLAKYVQRAIGLSATGRRERVLFIAEGNGNNGKSILLDNVRSVLGDYAAIVSSDLLMEASFAGNGNNATPELIKLKGKRMARASETQKGRKLNNALLKSMTGDEHRVARALHRESTEYVSTDTLWLATNHLPEIGVGEEAVFNRLRVIPFRQKFSSDKEPDIEKTIERERKGILAWIVAGAVDYLTNGLGTCQTVSDATKAMQIEKDSIIGFVEQCCTLGLGRITPDQLFQHYYNYCCQMEKSAVGRRDFLRQIRTSYNITDIRSSGKRLLSGIGVSSEWLLSDDDDFFSSNSTNPTFGVREPITHALAITA